MSRKFEVTSSKAAPIPEGIKSITLQYPDRVTGQMWADWWNVYYDELGDFEKSKRSPGAQMKAKFLASLPMLDSVVYVDASGTSHDVKKEGLTAPLCVCNFVAVTIDVELYKDLTIPNP